MRIRRRRGIPLLLLACLAFTGCAWLKSKSPWITPSKPPAPVSPPPVSMADKTFAEGMAALQEGGHELALERFTAAWKEQPGHAGVAREFEGALQALKKNGDAAYAQGKWEDAGRRWMGTLRHIGHPAVRAKEIPFTRAEIQALLDRLSANLMAKGLLEYRKGNIEAAIPQWKTILSYDPSNEEASRSVRTAAKQLENLKKIPATR